MAGIYTTDLLTITTFETGDTLAILEPGAPYTNASTLANDETDFPIQGTIHARSQFRTTGLGGIFADRVTPLTFGSEEYFFMWGVFLAGVAIDTLQNGGLQVLLGSGTGAFKAWYVGGRDVGTNPYGGWQNFVVDHTAATDNPIGGGGTTSYRYFGIGANVTNAIARGFPLGLDAMRYGRGTITITEGTSIAPANFIDMAAENDLNLNRWGLFQKSAGGFLYKGRLQYGSASTSTYFQGLNQNIVIDFTQHVPNNFNRIEIINSTSTVIWDNVVIQTLVTAGGRSTNSKGQLEVIDNATVSFNGCSFTDMDTFIFKGGTNANTLEDVTFRRCNTVFQNTATFTACTFEESYSTSSLIISGVNAADISLVTNCFFISTGSNHAVDLGNITSSVSRNWDGHTLLNYTTGTIGTFVGITGGLNSAITTNVSTNNTLTISVTNGATVPSIQNTGAGTVIVESNVTIFISVTDINNTPISAAQVAIYTITGDIEIFNGQTDSNGEVSTTYAANIPIYIRVRKSTTGSTRYRSLETTGNTGATGATLFLTLVEDTFTELII